MTSYLSYLIRRVGYVVISFFLLSIVVWIVILLPPGDYVTSYITALRETGEFVDTETAIAMRNYYGLDQSMVTQYFKWITRFVQGDLGLSFGSTHMQEQPVLTLLKSVVPWTVLMSLISAVSYTHLTLPTILIV